MTWLKELHYYPVHSWLEKVHPGIKFFSLLCYTVSLFFPIYSPLFFLLMMLQMVCLFTSNVSFQIYLKCFWNIRCFFYLGVLFCVVSHLSGLEIIVFFLKMIFFFSYFFSYIFSSNDSVIAAFFLHFFPNPSILRYLKLSFSFHFLTLRDRFEKEILANMSLNGQSYEKWSLKKNLLYLRYFISYRRKFKEAFLQEAKRRRALLKKRRIVANYPKMKFYDILFLSFHVLLILIYIMKVR